MAGSTWVRRGICALGIVVLVELIAPPVAAQTTTTAAPAGTTATTEATRRQPTDGDDRLAAVAVVAGLAISVALVLMVYKDRKGVRADQLVAARIPSIGTIDTRPEDIADLLDDGSATVPTIEPNALTLKQGATATFRAKQAGAAVSGTWAFAPAGFLNRTDGTGAADKIEVVAENVAKEVVVTFTKDGATATAKVEVQATAGRSITFSVLGPGLASAVVAVFAVGGAVALAFRDDFSSGIATFLGTALGAGAVGAATAVGGGTGSAPAGGSGGDAATPPS